MLYSNSWASKEGPRTKTRSTNLLERLSGELSELESRSRFRELRSAEGIDFTSNDYLGLSRHPALIQTVHEALDRIRSIGSTGSRLLRGNHPEHENLEETAAEFFRAESALYFNSGFDANLALFSALPSRRAALILDERVHASVKEGARASLGKKYTARHNDVDSFEDALRRARESGAHDLFIAVESVYSMDGDRAPLGDLLKLAQRYDASLVVDEAHATGVFGSSGRGWTEGLRDPALITVHTCSKALGVSGALVVGNRWVKNYLINTARPFIYSTAASPLMAAAVRRALALIDEEAWRRERLLALSEATRRLLSASLNRWQLAGDGTQILPVIIGQEPDTFAVAESLRHRGMDVRAIRPPTVPEGQSRLRISLNVGLKDSDLERLAHTLSTLEKEEITGKLMTVSSFPRRRESI